MEKTLYHGTSVEFDGNNINLDASSRPKDFGNGFYLTSIYKQAEKWSNRNKQISKNKYEIVKEYNYDEVIGMDILKILVLDEYNEKWLEYIVRNRNNIKIIDDDYDLVIGLMADSNVKELIKDYISDYITEDELLEELKFHYKNDQYTFKTKKSLQTLTFIKDYYNVDRSE